MSDVAHNNPDIVVWPSAGDTDVLPAFYEEDPDPLPAYSVSGYPVSIQFNPYTVTSSSVSRMELFDGNGTLVSNTYFMDASNDDQHIFSEHEYALFPLQRLEWNAYYRVEVDYVIDGETATKVWNFRTRDLNIPLYTITSTGESISATSGVPFAVYMPPESGTDSSGTASYSWNQGMTLSVESIDGNTLRIEASGSGTATIEFHGKTFTVNL